MKFYRPQVSIPHKTSQVPDNRKTVFKTNKQKITALKSLPRNSVCKYDRGEKSVILVDDIKSQLPPFHFIFGSSLNHDQSRQVPSGRGLGLDLLRHLFGAVVGQTQAHDGQHHGYLVEGTVLRLRLHLTGNLPLKRHEPEKKKKKKKVRGQPSVKTMSHS